MVSRETKSVRRGIRKGARKHAGTSIADMERIRKRRQSALELRMAGATLMDIVKLGIGYNDPAHVSRDLRKATDGIYQESIEDLLILDLARIDEMQKYCFLALRHKGDLAQVRNIMALMEFRRTTLGITPEVLQDRRNNSNRVVNNGIMVVQGTTGEFLSSMMEAAGASPEEIQKELKELESSSGSSQKETGKVIQGELVQGEVITQESKQETGAQAGENKKKLRVKLKTKPAASPPGTAKATTATQTRSTGSRVSDSALGDESPSEDLTERVERIAQRMDEAFDEAHEPRLGRLSDPAVKIISVPVKLPDSNQPVSPGVVYKLPPRKPSPEEGRRLVTRRLKRDTDMDIIRTRIHEERI